MPNGQIYRPNNIKVIPRVYLDWNSETNNEYWPADLQSGDWTSQQFKDRVVRLIGRLGEVWDNDPRVAWVQTGIIGYWGEQENPVGVTQDGWAQRMGDAYTNAFKNKKLIVRNMDDWPGYEMGVVLGFVLVIPRNQVIREHYPELQQSRPLPDPGDGRRSSLRLGKSRVRSAYGGEPEITLNNTQYTDNMIDVIRELHASALGWIG